MLSGVTVAGSSDSGESAPVGKIICILILYLLRSLNPSKIRRFRSGRSFAIRPSDTKVRGNVDPLYLD